MELIKTSLNCKQWNTWTLMLDCHVLLSVPSCFTFMSQGEGRVKVMGRPSYYIENAMSTGVLCVTI